MGSNIATGNDQCARGKLLRTYGAYTAVRTIAALPQVSIK